MITAFKNSDTERVFLDNGFVTFPFLDEERLDSVRKIYFSVNESERLSKEQFYGVNYSLGTTSPEENDTLVRKILSVIQEPLQVYFNEFEVLDFDFITSPPHSKTTFFYHQDWSYTDEEEHAYVRCWVPLVDTNINNGCIGIIDRSHRFFRTYRSDQLESSRIAFERIPAEIRTDIEQMAGSCFAFHQAAFRGSYPNSSDFSSPVLTFVVKHKKSPVVYYIKEEKEISAFQMSVTAFNKMRTQIPKCTLPLDSNKINRANLIHSLPGAKDIIVAYRTINPNHRLLKDFSFHEQFQKNGFLVLRNVVSTEIVNDLRRLYLDNFSTPGGMFVTHHAEKNATRNKAFSNTIFKTLSKLFESYFLDVKPLIAHFAVKAKGGDGLFNLHQDWSIVREELFGIMHCWIPLQDVTRKNGTLALLPQSHLCFHNYRSGTIPIRFLPIQSFNDSVLNIEAKVGDVVLYHPALFHGSEANCTDDDRIAVVAAVSHPGTEKTYHHEINNEIWAYEMTDEDLFSRLDELSKGESPLGEKLCLIENRKLNLRDNQIIEYLKQNCDHKNSNVNANI